jgi:hypothetical protein
MPMTNLIMQVLLVDQVELMVPAKVILRVQQELVILLQ